jgi:hypothetical protein
MSRSPYIAGRGADVAIVVASLLCATVLAVVGITARVGAINGAGASTRIEAGAPVLRAGGPNVLTSNEQNTIR